jgi:hypothetical protein
MSWQGYVDNLMQTNQMTHVGIFGLDGASWASSNQYPVSDLHSHSSFILIIISSSSIVKSARYGGIPSTTQTN